MQNLSTLEEIKYLEDTYALQVYPKRDIILVKGKNASLWDINGIEYIDCAAGIGVANIGHVNEHIIRAIIEQASNLITCPQIFYNKTRSLLLKKLAQITPDSLNKIFLCNSGAEAIEAAIKFTRSTTKKTELICANRGFHGRTFGALSATHNKKYKEDFMPLVKGFHHVPFNNFKKLKDKVTENTAGIILEVVQGEGGINIGKPEYFQKVREFCTENEIILIIDEIQSGFCRTGRFFAFEHYNIQPDILCIAKAIAGGLPMGATICSEKITIGMSQHGSTFGGNPLVCAAALAAIEYMEKENLAQQAHEKGKYFIENIQKYDLPIVRDIRHLGLMIGIELKKRNKQYLESLLKRRIIALPAGKTVIRLLPPLTISYQQIDQIIKHLIEVLTEP
ncbi:MAG: aspartate aminotransferase family protein [Candidatus Hermodarchaeota archaeon]